MTAPGANAPAPAFYTTAALAARWDCSPETVLNTARREGFPARLTIGARARWAVGDVHEWENQQRTAPPTRRTVTGTLPQHRAAAAGTRPARAPTTVRTRKAATSADRAVADPDRRR